jgi:hypothetical protein
MKKIITFFIIFLITFIFNGCSERDTKTDINSSINIANSSKIDISNTNQMEENKLSTATTIAIVAEKGIERVTSNIVTRIAMWILSALWNMIASIFIFLWTILIWIFSWIWAIPFIPEIVMGLIGLIIIFVIGEIGGL